MKKHFRLAAVVAAMTAIFMAIAMIGVGCASPEPPPDEEKPVEEVNPNLQYMTFELAEDGTYVFTELKRGAEGDIKIPGKYDGKTVSKIGANACIGNEMITSLVISEGITTIGENAFKNCKGITSVTFPDSLTTIEQYAFQKDSKITSLTFPKGLKTIGDHAFDTTSGCTSITFNEGLQSIGERCFDYNKATSIYLPDSLTHIGWRAFIYMKQVKTLSIGNKVTYIGDMAFSYWDRLEQIEFRGTKAQWNAIEVDESHTKFGLDYLASKEIESNSYTFKYSDSTYKVFPRQNNKDAVWREEKIS